MLRVLLLTLLLLLGDCASATCYEQAAASYANFGMTPALLQAIAKAESNANPKAMNLTHLAATGSYDIGLMQIDSRWLPDLARLGITEQALLEPCQNVLVAAWILAPLLKRYGPGWEAIGAYNAGCTQLKGAACSAARNKYAWSVYRAAMVQAQPPDFIAAQAPAAPRIKHVTLLNIAATLTTSHPEGHERQTP